MKQILSNGVKYSTTVGFENGDTRRGTLWTGSLKEVFMSSSAVSLNVLYTLYIFKAFDKVLISLKQNVSQITEAKFQIQPVILDVLVHSFSCNTVKTCPCSPFWPAGKFGFNLRSLKCLAQIISWNCSQNVLTN